jgi:hypothetical protein
MRRAVQCCSLLAVFLAVCSAIGIAQEKARDKSGQLRSNQALMRNKLVQMNLILEGITLDNFGQAEKSAETLKMISRAASWHIVDPTPQYKRLSMNFQEQAADLERHAKEKNVEAATLDLVRINVTCTHCHQHMREIAAARRK